MSSSCECLVAPNLIFACSGAADVGVVSDQAARQLTREGVGKMFCLAGIGGRITGIMKTTEAAKKNLVIDGCPLECAKRCLEVAGFNEFEHLNLADIELDKGKTDVTLGNIAKTAEAGKAKLASC
jgi:uncharacterized metal-binding protein